VPGIVGDVGVSTTGEAGGAAVDAERGAEADCLGQVGLGAAFLAAAFFGAAFLAAALGEAFAFLGAALATFFADLRAAPDFLALAFTLVFAFTLALGRVFFFATLFLAAGRLAFATGRFFDLLFFAMVTLLLEIVRTLCESSPEKVCCHLCMKLESVTRIA
jgi:hypothetical protein